MPNATNGLSILSTTSVPTNIVPGSTYYLGVQNTNSFTVNYGIEVDFHLLATNTIFITSITATNIGGKPTASCSSGRARPICCTKSSGRPVSRRSRGTRF